MTESELRSLLLTEPVPDEREAQQRSWAVVRTAFEQRERVPWVRRRGRPLIALAVVVALLAAAFTPPGQGLAERLREAVAPPAPEPLTLPTQGRLLVASDAGAWVVQKDGSKRLLGAYEDAVWSPRGLFVGATRGRTLVALEPNGRVRWTLSHRTALSQPRWSPSGFRIAYRSGDALRVVAGDGTSDKVLARSAGEAAPSWRPGSAHVLAFADDQDRINIVNTDTGSGVLVGTHVAGAARELAWSSDGTRLLALLAERIEIYTEAGRQIRTIPAPSGQTATDVAPAPEGRQLAFTVHDARAGRSSVLLADVGGPREPVTLFTGEGRFDGLAWSPDGRWLLVGWPDADQWLFLRAPDVRRVLTIPSVAAEFDPGGSGEGRFARIVSWCCAD
jgi:dipeptidyl aminopeptidase/acylaminoacyl peptidase